MRVGVFGTGGVGQPLAGKFAELGHEVMVGTRDPEASLAKTTSDYAWVPAFGVWAAEHVDVKVGTFEETAKHGELLVNATHGQASLEVLAAAGDDNLAGKILLDVSNPLDFSKGMPPTLSVVNDDSLGEQIQRAHPNARVVKTLNTVSAPVMIAPGSIGEGDHAVFVSGNDAGAKLEATRVLQEWFGWREVIDLGDITTSRGAEMYLALWIRLMGVLGGPNFNVRFVR